jgi:hypothetical protein
MCPAGLFFLAWGLYWTVCIFHSYLLQQFPATAKGKKHAAAGSTLVCYTFPSYQGTRKQLIEPVAKLVLGLYGVTWAFHHQLAWGIRRGDCWCVAVVPAPSATALTHEGQQWTKCSDATACLLTWSSTLHCTGIVPTNVVDNDVLRVGTTASPASRTCR